MNSDRSPSAPLSTGPLSPCKQRQAAPSGTRLYDLPKFHPRLGPLSPDLNDVARVLGRETGSKVQIAGASAAHLLALTTQVPAQSAYLTDGPSRRVVQQVLRHLGRTRADAVVAIAAPAWMRPALLAITDIGTGKDCNHPMGRERDLPR